jgi:hypothetical protein
VQGRLGRGRRTLNRILMSIARQGIGTVRARARKLPFWIKSPLSRFVRTASRITVLQIEPSPFNDIRALRSRFFPLTASKTLLVPFGFTPNKGEPLRIAVMIHAFYPEILPTILDQIKVLNGSPNIFITTDTEEKQTKIESMLACLPEMKGEVRLWPNRGRDVGAKLFGLADCYAGHDLVLHLHTKKSLHAEGGHDWFGYLLKTLVGSEEVVRSVLAAFAAQPRLGIVFADHWPAMRSWINWGYDFPFARDFATRMGFAIFRDEPLEFPSGSMFWARPEALAPLVALRLEPHDFPEESGQVDGTPAHAIERLFLRVCEHAGYSWCQIAHSEFTDVATRAVEISSSAQLTQILKQHASFAGDPGLRPSVRVLRDRPESWPLWVAPEFDARPRLNLFLPAFRRSSVFGGIATAFAIFERIAQAVDPEIELRILLTADPTPVDPQDLPPGWKLSEGKDDVLAGQRSVVVVPPQSRAEIAVSVRPSDIFFASAWWDAIAGFSCIDRQREFFRMDRKLRYFLQDFEPNFSAWSSAWTLADQTYRRPDDTVAIVNSSFLAAYFEKHGYHFAEQYVFKPLWNAGLGQPVQTEEARENIILVYWRPSVERNLHQIAASGLAQWLESDPYAARNWRIFGIGEAGADVMLTEGFRMQVLGKLSLDEYRRLLCRAKVGLSLMLSPHPSYPPLEMAAFGMRVVTNSFEAKNLSGHGDAINSLDLPNPAAIAKALADAVGAWSSGSPGRVGLTIETAFATERDLDALAASVAAGIRSEIAATCQQS